MGTGFVFSWFLKRKIKGVAAGLGKTGDF